MQLLNLVFLGLVVGAMTIVTERPSDPSDDEDYESSEDGVSGETDKVYGGGYAPLGLFPFMVAVHRLVQSPNKFVVCSGSVISKRWVLTAGHCLYGPPRLYLLAFGLVDKEGIRYDRVTRGGFSMVSGRTFIHPKFGMGLNDVGLVHTPRDIPFGETIQPIRLAGEAYAPETFEGELAQIFGWGQEGPGQPASQRLRFGFATIISKVNCLRRWQITDDHICTAATEAQDVCQGDSGGPLVIREADDQLVQIGIVSFGDAGCPSYRPAVYSRVSSYADWIYEITGVESINHSEADSFGL